MADWQDLKDIDFYALENPRMGIRCGNPEMLDDLLDQFRMRAGSRGGNLMLIDYRDCSTSEEYQQKIIDVVSEFIRASYPDQASGLGEGPLNTQASNCLGLLEWIADELRKQFTLVVDFRGIKIDPSILRPGQKFWWAYDSASRCKVSNLIWVMDDDSKGAELLEKHGQMKRVFSEEGTNVFLSL
ncbi:MAG: hypothetical protein SVM80_01755 [Halobacteriota archaeon]|nr:hypothetical protein [Halobacteriota archaeon]